MHANIRKKVKSPLLHLVLILRRRLRSQSSKRLFHVYSIIEKYLGFTAREDFYDGSIQHFPMTFGSFCQQKDTRLRIFSTCQNKKFLYSTNFKNLSGIHLFKNCIHIMKNLHWSHKINAK